MKENFIINFAWRGTKWNLIDHIFTIKQEVKETMCVYIRCTISVILGINVKWKIDVYINELYVHALQNCLIAQMCKSFAEAWSVVINFEE